MATLIRMELNLTDLGTPGFDLDSYFKKIKSKDRLSFLISLFKVTDQLLLQGKQETEEVSVLQMNSLRVAKLLYEHSTPVQRKKWFSQLLELKNLWNWSVRNWYIDECLDRIIGLNERALQAELKKREKLPQQYVLEDTYLENTPENLYTPYRVLLDQVRRFKLKASSGLVDLGSGLGRVGLVFGYFYPKSPITGIELMPERCELSQNAKRDLGLNNLTFICANIMDIQLPLAQNYFLFNPFSLRTLKHVFRELELISFEKKIRVLINQVGRPPRLVKRQPWLKLKYKSKPFPLWPGKSYQVFESRY